MHDLDGSNLAPLFPSFQSRAFALRVRVPRLPSASASSGSGGRAAAVVASYNDRCAALLWLLHWCLSKMGLKTLANLAHRQDGEALSENARAVLHAFWEMPRHTQASTLESNLVCGYLPATFSRQLSPLVSRNDAGDYPLFPPSWCKSTVYRVWASSVPDRISFLRSHAGCTFGRRLQGKASGNGELRKELNMLRRAARSDNVVQATRLETDWPRHAIIMEMLPGLRATVCGPGCCRNAHGRTRCHIHRPNLCNRQGGAWCCSSALSLQLC